MSSSDTPPAPSDQVAESAAEAPSGEWIATAVTALFTAVAVLLASFLAVLSGLA